jgi:hypothetical protein
MTELKQPKLAEYTTIWNTLAAEAIALGIPKVKLHKVETRPGEPSTFPSYRIATERVAWLEAQLAAAKATTKGMDEIKAAAEVVTKKVGKKPRAKADDASTAEAAPKKPRKSRAKKAPTAEVIAD